MIGKKFLILTTLAAWGITSFNACRKYNDDCEATISVKMKDAGQNDILVPVRDATVRIDFEKPENYNGFGYEELLTDSSGNTHFIWKDPIKGKVSISKGNRKAEPFTIKVRHGAIVSETVELK